jgi:hypothetical protein
MKGLLIGADFLRLESEVKFLEINTDVDLYTYDINFLELDNLFNYLTENSFEKFVLVYKTKHIDSGIVSLFEQMCNQNSIEFDKIIIPNNSITIPTLIDTPETFYLRCAYDVTAIIDDLYCRDKSEIVSLLFESDNADLLPKTFVKNPNNDITYDNLDSIQLNGNNPNLISKKILPDFEKNEFPKFWKIDDVTELPAIKNSLNDTVLLQEFLYNPNELNDGRICDSIRTWTVLLSDVESMIYIGGNITANKLVLQEEDITYTDSVLDKKWRAMYFSNPISLSNGIPGDYEVIKLVDDVEVIVQIQDVQIGDIIKSIELTGLSSIAPLREAYDWSSDAEVTEIVNYTTSSVVGKQTHPFEDWVSEITYEVDGNIISASFADTEPIVVRDATNSLIRFKKASDILVGDYLITSDRNELLVSNTTAKWYIGEFVTINIEPIDVFIAGTDLNSINIGSSGGIFVHNYKCTWCCFAEGTMIKSENGDVKIEDINIGDLVWSYNFKTNSKELKSVVGKTEPYHNNIIKILFENGTSIICTTDHPLYHKNGNLVSFDSILTNSWYTDGNVETLNIGDELISFDIETLKVQNIEVIANNIKTHTLFVEDNKNFYANNVLVFDENKIK